MSEENKATLRDGVRFATIIILMIMCLVFLVVQWMYPRNPKMDEESLNKIEGLSKVFTEVKTQNDQIIKQNNEASAKLTLLLKSREEQRDDIYQQLLDKYQNQPKK